MYNIILLLSTNKALFIILINIITYFHIYIYIYRVLFIIFYLLFSKIQ